MIVYIGVIAYIIVLGFCSKYCAKDKKGHIFAFISLGIFMILSAFRNETVGSDTLEYLNIYDMIVEKSWMSVRNMGLEDGYSYFNKLCHSCLYIDNAILIGNALLFYILVINLIRKKSVNSYFSVFVFICLYIPFAQMNIMRQMIAISIIGYAYFYMLDNKMIKTTILILIAAQFHTSAYLFIPLFFITSKIVTKKRVYFFACFSVLAYILSEYVYIVVYRYFPLYGKYMNISGDGGGFFTLVIFIILILIWLYNHNKKCEVEKSDVRMISVVCFAAAICIVGNNIPILSRLKYYFFYLVIFQMPQILEHSRNRQVVKTIMISMCVIYFLFMFYINSGAVRPYSIW